MRLDYLDYQIVYLEDTGDASVYSNRKEIIYAHIDKWLSPEKVVESISLLMSVMPEIRKTLSRKAC